MANCIRHFFGAAQPSIFSASQPLSLSAFCCYDDIKETQHQDLFPCSFADSRSACLILSASLSLSQALILSASLSLFFFACYPLTHSLARLLDLSSDYTVRRWQVCIPLLTIPLGFGKLLDEQYRTQVCATMNTTILKLPLPLPLLPPLPLPLLYRC